MCFELFIFFFFSSRRRHTRCALVTGVQTCALPIFPGGGVDASYQRRRLADAERPGGQPREGDALRLGAEASWEIDLFGRVRRGIEAAEAEVGGAEALLRSARAAVTADVASHYFELRGSEAALAIAQIGSASWRERGCQSV